MTYQQLSDFFDSWLSSAIALFWGIAEGIFFFIVPDVYIGAVMLFRPRQGIRSLGYSVVGSLISACLLYIFRFAFIAAIPLWFLSLPGVTAPMIATTTMQMQQYGLSSLLLGPVSGIPYKIYTVIAIQHHLPLLQYLAWSIPSRIERLGITYLITGSVVLTMHRSIRIHPKAALGVYLGIWTGIYIWYFSAIS